LYLSGKDSGSNPSGMTQVSLYIYRTNMYLNRQLRDLSASSDVKS